MKTTDVALIYPYFNPRLDRSIFRFPPLGLGYIASYLRNNGITVDIVDCTFLSEKEALKRARDLKPTIIGIHSMVTLREPAIRFARLLKDYCDLLVAGGPYPTVNPALFLNDFDIVVAGEGEQTMLEIAKAHQSDGKFWGIPGIVYKKRTEEENHCECKVANENLNAIAYTKPRNPIKNLDALPFPAHDLFPQEDYKKYWRKKYGYTMTHLITTRGCPFNCEFCSRPVFGRSYRERSAKNVVDEIESLLSLGYDRIWFSDDVFTLNKQRVIEICYEILLRRLRFEWECLSRVDNVDKSLARKMRHAGCRRVFFGLESGNNAILRLMKKGFTIDAAKRAVKTMRSAGIRVGAFFMVGYPGETEETVLDTVRFSSSLSLDYLSYTLPYPLPGTDLHERIKERMKRGEWKKSRHNKLLFESPISEAKLKFAIRKGYVQYRLQKYLNKLYFLAGTPFEKITDRMFRMLK